MILPRTAPAVRSNGTFHSNLQILLSTSVSLDRTRLYTTLPIMRYLTAATDLYLTSHELLLFNQYLPRTPWRASTYMRFVRIVREWFIGAVGPQCTVYKHIRSFHLTRTLTN